MLINRSGTMVVPFMSLYLTQAKHFSISQSGLVMAIFGAGAICGGILGGKLTDKLGFYNIQLSALIIGGILFILLGQMNTYLSICICTFVLSVLNESFRPANSTAIAHYSKEANRTRSYSLNRLAINLGWATGGALGGFIASKNYQLLFWIDGLTNIGAALLLLAVLAPARNEHTPSKSDIKPVERSHSAYRDKAYLAFIVFTIMFAYCVFQTFSIQPLYYNRVLHLSPFTIGLIMAMNGLLVALFEMVIIHNLEGKRDILQYIISGVLLLGISFMIYNVLPGGLYLAVLGTLIFTVGEILSMPFMNTFWINRTNKTNRGQYAGLYTVAWSTAQVLGPGTGSLIAGHWGFTSLWWIVGAICTTSALGYKWLQGLRS